MGNTFSDVVRFRKAWRPSQAVLMSHVEQDLADGRLHYVVAPGGGKKSIGLELIRRLDAPALILSSTQKASDEWRTRLQEDFLPEGEDLKKWASKDASVAAPIISVTYQAMFAAMNIGRPFAKWMQNAGVQTLCLDEPYHLRNEWWKMLEKLVGQMPELRILTLTATEPFDATEVEWERYLNLCGPVDEELSVPELVREGVLCPHQDYVYLCRPEEAALAQIGELRLNGKKALARLLHDVEFLAAVKTHLGLAVPDAYAEFFRENQAYFMAFLCFLKANAVEIPAALLGRGADLDVLPAMTVERMETLLKGFFGYDKESYDGCREYQKRLEAELKEEGAIVRGKVDMMRPIEVKRVLNTGHEKFVAIERIVRTERATLGDDMHMLILTEHIKKEQMPIVGEPDKELKDIGALPVFEALRRADIEGIYMMVMTGTLMMIPAYLVPWFEEHTSLKWAPVKETGYCRLQMAADCMPEAMKWMTMMYEEGYANVLIGTASQLNDGWSCPCVNSLVLATKVGTYAVTNQMRGRVLAAQPGKVTNIWHVATVDPDMRPGAAQDFLRMSGGDLRREPGTATALLEAGSFSEDFEGVMRRFYTFLGVRMDQPVIENGLTRALGPIGGDSAEEIEAHNQAVLRRAGDRAAVKKAWMEALKMSAGHHGVVEEVICERREFPKTEGQKAAERGTAMCLAGAALVLAEAVGTRFLAQFAGTWVALVVYAVLLILLVLQLRNNRRVLAKKKTPQDWMEGFAHGVMEALQDGEVITSTDVSFAVRREGEGEWHLALTGATAQEHTAFAECLTEFLGPVGDARYLILERLADGTDTYYPVPEMFSLSKADARLFYRNMNEYMGDVILVYTGADRGGDSLKAAQWESKRRLGGAPVHHKKVF